MGQKTLGTTGLGYAGTIFPGIFQDGIAAVGLYYILYYLKYKYICTNIYINDDSVYFRMEFYYLVYYANIQPLILFINNHLKQCKSLKPKLG